MTRDELRRAILVYVRDLAYRTSARVEVRVKGPKIADKINCDKSLSQLPNADKNVGSNPPKTALTSFV